MRYVRLGKTDLDVSAIAFGTWAFGGEWGSFDEDEARGAIHHALDLGVTFFDTAQAYGFGVSERVLADALWERVRRDDVTVGTKGGLRMEGHTVLRDAGAPWLREGVESSLRNLGTDHIDLYQIHWPDGHTPAEETGEALEGLVREGKIRHVGVSNYDAKQMDELSRYGRVETDQPPYHMFRRGIEAEILPYAADHDIGVLVYGPLAHGLLSGRMTPETTFPADDWRSHSSDFTADVPAEPPGGGAPEGVRGRARHHASAARGGLGHRSPGRARGDRGSTPCIAARWDGAGRRHRALGAGPRGDRPDTVQRRAVDRPIAGGHVRSEEG